MAAVGSSGDDYTLTPTTMKYGTSITFAAVHACVTLVWQTGGWVVASWSNVTIANS